MTVLAVAHDPYRHGRADDAGHGPDGAVIVTRLAPDRAAFDKLSRSRVVLGPPLPYDRARNRALHRPAHIRPGDWRPGVEKHAASHAGNCGFGEPDALEDRLRRKIGGIGFAVGRLDILMIDEPGERPADRSVSHSRRRPLDLNGLAAGVGDRLGERREADIEDLQVFTEELHNASRSPARPVFACSTSPAASAHRFGIAAREDHAGLAKRRLLRG